MNNYFILEGDLENGKTCFITDFNIDKFNISFSYAIVETKDRKIKKIVNHMPNENIKLGIRKFKEMFHNNNITKNFKKFNNFFNVFISVYCNDDIIFSVDENGFYFSNGYNKVYINNNENKNSLIDKIKSLLNKNNNFSYNTH